MKEEMSEHTADVYFNKNISEEVLESIKNSVIENLKNTGISADFNINSATELMPVNSLTVSLEGIRIKVNPESEIEGVSYEELQESSGLNSFLKSQLVKACTNAAAEFSDSITFNEDPHGNIGFDYSNIDGLDV